ncbi:DUF6940 family protein [Hahella sp. NBU794]|uniref:DUF6940 family protein n=1 Tax=Hahella sp. NBU794 TaxID=3422590 RepID=UPI003D6DC43C
MADFSVEATRLAHYDGCRYALFHQGAPLSYLEALQLLEENPAFRAFFNSIFASADSSGYFWESPPLSSANESQACEFVLINSGPLTRLQPDWRPFAKPFRASRQSDLVAAFNNLGGDARLVAPRPQTKHCDYAHLARFIRNAPPQQVDAFWIYLARETLARIGEQPVWLSTAGLGVSWLHARICVTPKYYRYAPYAAHPA